MGWGGCPLPPIPDLFEQKAEDEADASQHPCPQPEQAEAERRDQEHSENVDDRIQGWVGDQGIDVDPRVEKARAENADDHDHRAQPAP